MNTDILPKHFGKLINKTFKSRQESDYEAFITYEEDEVLQILQEMKTFIQALKQYLTE